MENTLESLVSSISQSQTIEIIYNGGSMPGSTRTIFPILIKDGQLRARDEATQKVKIYEISKIEFPKKSQTYHEYIPYTEITVENDAFFDIIKTECLKIIPDDFMVVINENELTVNKKKKNGEPLKTSIASIYYQELGADFLVDLETGELTTGTPYLRDRPWVVYGKKKQTKTFKYQEKAGVCFLQYVFSIFRSY